MVKKVVSGRIDRLAVFEEYVFLADFKTGYAQQNANEIPVLMQKGTLIHDFSAIS
ncbi:MAG: Double-strand break repair helicase AddA [Candidatus Tokpelaia sp. JSC085]|nr:MAG: Double-strand break repair helicase AddA [Candidatus Tokpelaia sp. JSC085]